ncbi:MAG: hypothetical protein PVF69_08870 [Gemmatimonadota bacterium]
MCTSESTDPGQDDPPVDFADGLETVACTGLSLTTTSGLPLDLVDAGSVPSSLEPPLVARVLSGDGTMLSYAWFESNDEGGVDLVAPLHPSGSIEGGDVWIRATDGDVACEPWEFTIEPLPASPGEFGAVVDQLHEVLRAQAEVLETTPEALQTTSPEDLPDALKPLALIQWVLDHPDNDGSLRAIAAEDPDAPLELIDALLARTGLREALEAGSAAAATRAPPARATVEPEDCTRETITDAQRLSDCMNAAADLRGDWTRVIEPETDKLALLVAATVLLPNPKPGLRAALDGVDWVWFAQRVIVTAGMPSDFRLDGRGWINESVGWDVPYPEDYPLLGLWQAAVSAEIPGWESEFELFRGKFGTTIFGKLKELGTDLGPVWAARDVFGTAYENLGSYDIEGTMTLPIDVSSDPWSHMSFYPVEPYTLLSVTPASHNEYRVSRVGVTELRAVVPDPSATEVLFGGSMLDIPRYPTQPGPMVSVDSIIVRVEPSDTVLAAGASATLRVTVENAFFPDSLAVTVGEGSSAPLESTGDNTFDLVYTAPSSPSLALDYVEVEHTAKTGARDDRFPRAPRSGRAWVVVAQLRIATELSCIEPGTQPIQIELEDTGEGPAQAVLVWDASLGTISDDGRYTPPSEPGLETITVAVDGYPEISDSLEFQVGGCSVCQATINVGGATDETHRLVFDISDDRSGVEGVEWYADNQVGDTHSEAVFGFGTDPTSRQVIPFGTTGTFAAQGSGQINGTTFFNFDGDGYPKAPLGLVVEENTDTTFVGTISGPVSLASTIPPGTASFSLEFRILADPDLSTSTGGVCEVPTP